MSTALNDEKLHNLAKKIGDDWVSGSYYGDAEKFINVQWDSVIWPLIKDVDFSNTLDLAAGHGRNTEKLLEHADIITAVDINESNISVLKSRFKSKNNVELVQNNGIDLRDINGDSISFLYSFDAMVHFDSDVIRSYIKEFRRIMKPGAQGFCHYSNNDHNPTGSYRDHPGWRNFMSKELFEHWLTKEGFTITRSHYLRYLSTITEVEDEHCDAITLFTLPKDAIPLGAFLYPTHETQNLQNIELGRTKKELNDLRTSTSWRVTKPFRWLTGNIRKLLK